MSEGGAVAAMWGGGGVIEAGGAGGVLCQCGGVSRMRESSSLYMLEGFLMAVGGSLG